MQRAGASVRGVIWQTIVKKHSSMTLYQDRDALIQEAGLFSLARVDSHPTRPIITTTLPSFQFHRVYT